MLCKVILVAFYEQIAQRAPRQNVVSVSPTCINHNEDHDEALNGASFWFSDDLVLSLEFDIAKLSDISKLPGRTLTRFNLN